MDKRLLVIILIALVIGAVIFAIIKFAAPNELPPVTHPTAGKPAPALGGIDKALVDAPAPPLPTPVPFIDTSKPALRLLVKLSGGEQASALDFSADGKYLIVVDYGDSTLRVWDWREGKEVSRQKHHHRLTDVAAAPGGGAVWTGDAKQGLYRWPLSAEGQLGAGERVGDKLGGQLHIAISPNGRLVAACSWDRAFSIWDAEGRKLLAQVEIEERPACVAFSHDGRRLMVGATTNVIVEYDLASGNGRKIVTKPMQDITTIFTVAYSPDGKRFSTGHNQPWVTIYDAPKMEYRHFLQCPMAAIMTLTYSRDSRWIVFGQGDNSIQVWDPEVAAETGSVIALKGHQKFVKDLAFSRDGAVLASCEESPDVYLWTKPD